MSLIASSLLVVANMAMPSPEMPFFRDTLSIGNLPMIYVEVFVDPDGVVLECDVLEYEGSRRISRQICRQAVGKDIGEGARNDAGQPAHAVMMLSRVQGQNPDENLGAAPPAALVRAAQLQVMVAQLPGDGRNRRVDVLTEIAADGSVAACAPVLGDADAFTRIACDQATTHRFDSRDGGDGRPVSYVITLSVDFVLDD